MTNSSKIQNYLVFLLIIVLTGSAFYMSYAVNIPGPVLAIVWILWLILGLGISYLSSPGKAVFDFAKQAKAELMKVVWPSKQETVQTTTIVVVMVCVTGFLLWLADSALMWIIGKITHLG